MAKADDTLLAEKYKAFSYGAQEFDKSIRYIASGALGISFAFIEKIVKLDAFTRHKELLYHAWYLFTAVILLSMIAYYVIQEINRWAIEHHVDASDSITLKKAYEKKANRFNWLMRLINYSMVLMLIIGLLNLIGFVEWNL
jgi:hypothetical protein